jgi:hypothetical protein
MNSFNNVGYAAHGEQEINNKQFGGSRYGGGNGLANGGLSQRYSQNSGMPIMPPPGLHAQPGMRKMNTFGQQMN